MAGFGSVLVRRAPRCSWRVAATGVVVVGEVTVAASGALSVPDPVVLRSELAQRWSELDGGSIERDDAPWLRAMVDAGIVVVEPLEA